LVYFEQDEYDEKHFYRFSQLMKYSYVELKNTNIFVIFLEKYVY